MRCAKSALNWPDGSESGVKDGNGIDRLIIGLPYRHFLSHLTAVWQRQQQSKDKCLD